MMEKTQAPCWLHIASISDFDSSRRLVREVEGRSILLLQLGKAIIALYNVCTHLGQPLDRGRVVAGQLICPFHGACFDLRTGAALSGPAVAPLLLFPVKLENTEVLIDVGTLPASIIRKSSNC
jgi:nitrite reductase/ring-hydroxylating ferredoxin subunit